LHGTLLVPAGSNTTLRAQQAFARDRKDYAKRVLDSIAASRDYLKPGEVSLDYTFQESWLRAAIGDTLAATRQLDLVLNSLSMQTVSLLRWIEQAAALPRAMALRAQLAAARGEDDVARRWGSGVLALWRDADPELAPVIARMRAFADPR
jgi:hypothetical protein